MPQGYYTIEQWTTSKNEAKVDWVAILNLPFGTSLTKAEEALSKLGEPGFYRIVQMQRVIWAEQDAGKLRLRKSHAGSPASLESMRQMFDRCGGVYPLAEVQEERCRQKAKRAK